VDRAVDRAHRQLTADHVNDAVRIAATIYAAAVALEAGEPASGAAADEPAVIEVSIERA
jgi:hypothetical protein